MPGAEPAGAGLGVPGHRPVPYPARRARARRRRRGPTRASRSRRRAARSPPPLPWPRIMRSSSLDRADDPEVELVVHRPEDLRRPGQLERVVDPLDERVGAVRAELRLELELADLERRAWRPISRIRSVLPTSPGRTTCRSSMKKTDTRLASRMSSIWALPVRAFAGVKRLVLIVRMRCASSRIDDVERLGDVRGVAEVLEQRAGARRRRSCAGSR